MFKKALITLLLLFAPVIAQADDLSPEKLAQRTFERRAVEAAIWGMPVVNYDQMLQEMLTKTKAKVNEVVYWGQALDWHNQTLTPNPDTIYFIVFYNTKNGPMVFDLPASGADGSFNGNIVTTWQLPLEDAGQLGIDKGAGGKFLVLPPGYTRPKPDEYKIIQSETYGGFMLFRANLAGHDDANVARSIAYGKTMKIYPLAEASNPPPTVFTDAKDMIFDSTIRYDASLFDHINRVVQDEPWLDRDRIMINQLKTLGIEKGKPFDPSDEQKKMLASAAREAGAFFDQMYEAGMPPFFSATSRWTFPAPPDAIKAAGEAFSDPNDYPVDHRSLPYTYAFVGIKHLGVGQFYMISLRDKEGDAFEGGNAYRLTVPANVPVSQYWSVTAYDRERHSLIRNMARASRASILPELQKNADGSIDIYFGPEAPAGKESNWVPTDPARKFDLMFRVYGPKKEFFDKVWVLPDVEKVSGK